MHYEVLVAGTLASVACFPFWRFAQRAAREVGERLGDAPAWLPVLTCLAALFVSLVSHTPLQAASWTLVVTAALVSAVTDARTGLIFDYVTGSAGLGVLAISIAAHQLVPVLIGSAVLGVLFMCMYWSSRTHQGLGLGDVKLAMLIGAGFAWPMGMAAVSIATMTCVAYYLPYIIRKTEPRAVAFGPFLFLGSLGAVAAQLWAA